MLRKIWWIWKMYIKIVDNGVFLFLPSPERLYTWIYLTLLLKYVFLIYFQAVQAFLIYLQLAVQRTLCCGILWFIVSSSFIPLLNIGLSTPLGLILGFSHPAPASPLYGYKNILKPCFKYTVYCVTIRA